MRVAITVQPTTCYLGNKEMFQISVKNVANRLPSNVIYDEKNSPSVLPGPQKIMVEFVAVDEDNTQLFNKIMHNFVTRGNELMVLGMNLFGKQNFLLLKNFCLNHKVVLLKRDSVACEKIRSLINLVKFQSY